MADDVFEFLHMEVVEMICGSVSDEEKDFRRHSQANKHQSTIVQKENSLSKLESLGFRVGQSLVERFTKDTPRFKDELDTMKFICKDFWSALYKKQIDNLRTNHQGVFVLQENRFKLLTQMSNNKQFIELAPKYLAFPCGLIRGALANFGIISIVTAEVTVMPACKFQIQIQRV